MPIFYSLAYHSLSFTKDDPNIVAREFIDYIRKTNKIINKDLAKDINV
jgi:hypothetical protein